MTDTWTELVELTDDIVIELVEFMDGNVTGLIGDTLTASAESSDNTV